MKFFFYLLLFTFLIFSCSQHKYQKVSITYNDLSKLNSKSYLKIDNHIIYHSSSAKLLRYNKALPMEYINMFDSKKADSPVIKTKNSMVLEALRDILLDMNEYNFDSIMYLEQINKVIISRKDKKKIRLNFSDDYPVTFKSIK